MIKRNIYRRISWSRSGYWSWSYSGSGTRSYSGSGTVSLVRAFPGSWSGYRSLAYSESSSR